VEVRITLEKLTERKPEPPDEVLKASVEQAMKIFKRNGLKETELLSKVSGPFGRILFDLSTWSGGCWSNGRPEYESEYADARKGIMIAGTVGVGKTLAMRIISSALNGEYLTVPELGTIFSTKGAEGFWAEVSRAGRWDLFLDDLGAEKEVKNYSNTLPIEELIYKRYDLWQTKGIRTHMTTNLSGKQIAERYGARIADRLKEMMTFVVCSGESMRK
jgi:hypothetical protein